jgi:hypothetical protein
MCIKCTGKLFKQAVKRTTPPVANYTIDRTEWVCHGIQLQTTFNSKIISQQVPQQKYTNKVNVPTHLPATGHHHKATKQTTSGTIFIKINTFCASKPLYLLSAITHMNGTKNNKNKLLHLNSRVNILL